MSGGEIVSYWDGLRDRLDKYRLALGSFLDWFYSSFGPRLETDQIKHH